MIEDLFRDDTVIIVSTFGKYTQSAIEMTRKFGHYTVMDIGTKLQYNGYQNNDIVCTDNQNMAWIISLIDVDIVTPVDGDNHRAKRFNERNLINRFACI